MPDLTVWPTDGADGSVSSEARWRKMARLWVPSGVVASGLAPTLVAGPTINVAAGAAWMDGHYAELTAPASVPATANGLLVVRFTPADNHAELLYRDAASTPTQTDPTWELPIAKMTAGVLADTRINAVASGAPIYPALPAFPYDGQEINFWHAASGRTWRLVYVAAAPAPYRWCVAGGAPLSARVATNENQTALGVWGGLATAGPDITLPLPGIYQLSWGFNGNNVPAAAVLQMGPVPLPTPTPPNVAIQSNKGATLDAVGFTPSGDAEQTFATPAQAIRCLYQTTGGASFYAQRWLTAMPVRVG